MKQIEPTGHATETILFPRPEKLIVLPEVVIYEDCDYEGHSLRTNLNMKVIGRGFNKNISSIVVVQGTWRFYRDYNYLGDYWDLEAGYYPSLGDISDTISSFQCIGTFIQLTKDDKSKSWLSILFGK